MGLDWSALAKIDWWRLVWMNLAIAALVGGTVDKAAIAAAASAAEAIADPASDGRGPAEFRTKLTGVMVRRAITAALSRAQSTY